MFIYPKHWLQKQKRVAQRLWDLSHGHIREVVSLNITVSFVFLFCSYPLHHSPCSCTVTHPSFSQDMSSSSDSLELEAGTVSQPLSNSILICALWDDGCFCLQLGLDSQIPSDVWLLKFASMSSWDHCVINAIYFVVCLYQEDTCPVRHCDCLWADMLVNVVCLFPPVFCLKFVIYKSPSCWLLNKDHLRSIKAFSHRTWGNYILQKWKIYLFKFTLLNALFKYLSVCRCGVYPYPKRNAWKQKMASLDSSSRRQNHSYGSSDCTMTILLWV